MEKGEGTMTEFERPRSYKDERDEMIDRETNGAALDAIITGAEVLAIVCWRRKKSSVEGRAGRKILADG